MIAMVIIVTPCLLQVTKRSTPRQGSWELVLQHFDELKAQPGRSGRVPYAAYSGAMQAWDQQHTEDRETKNGKIMENWDGEIGVRVWFAWGFERFGLVSWLVEMVWWIEVVWGGCPLFWLGHVVRVFIYRLPVLVLHDSTSTRLAEKSNSGRKSNSKARHRWQAAEDLPREAHVACEDGAF